MDGQELILGEGWEIPDLDDDDNADWRMNVIGKYPWWTHWMHCYKSSQDVYPPVDTSAWNKHGQVASPDSSGHITKGTIMTLNP